MCFQKAALLSVGAGKEGLEKGRQVRAECGGGRAVWGSPLWAALVSARRNEEETPSTPAGLPVSPSHKPSSLQACTETWVGSSYRQASICTRSLGAGHLSGLSSWNEHPQSITQGAPRVVEQPR